MPTCVHDLDIRDDAAWLSDQAKRRWNPYDSRPYLPRPECRVSYSATARQRCRPVPLAEDAEVAETVSSDKDRVGAHIVAWLGESLLVGGVLHRPTAEPFIALEVGVNLRVLDGAYEPTLAQGSFESLLCDPRTETFRLDQMGDVGRRLTATGYAPVGAPMIEVFRPEALRHQGEEWGL